jgi:hypothetical protein
MLGHAVVSMRRANGRGPPRDLSHPPGPTAPSTRNDHVDVTGAKLSHLSLLHRVGQYGDQHPGWRVLAHGADLNLGSGPVPLREMNDNPWVSLLGLTFGYLCQILFLNVCMFLCRILSMLVAPCGGITLPKDVVRQEANRVYSE